MSSRLSTLSALLFSLAALSAVTPNAHAGQFPRPTTPAERARATALAQSLHGHAVPASKMSPKTLASALPSSVSLSVAKALRSSSTIYFTDDVEGGTNGWSTIPGGDTALWHQTTRDANSPVHSWWDGIEGTGTYNSGARVLNALVSPAIDLSSAAGPVALLFTENYFTEKGWDFCMVDASTDGGTVWSHLRGGYGESSSGDTRGWRVTTLDLTPYAGNVLHLRFLFDTGDSLFNDYPGWMIDNVTVFDQAASVAGFVYFDINQDGAFEDSTESGLDNRLITATGPITITTRTTNGTFGFPLPLGSYQLTEALEPPWVLTSTPSSYSVDLTVAGGYDGGKNFGNYRAGCIIRGSIFNDVDGNAVQDTGEPPFVDGLVVLTDDLELTWAETWCDSAGSFALASFDAGQRLLRHYLLSRWVSTVPGGGTPQYAITIPPVDTTLSGFLFGDHYVPPAGGMIRGMVFDDLNENGVFDYREPGLPGRVLKLDYVDKFAMTDSSGWYTFSQLGAGNYSIRLAGEYRWGTSFPDSGYYVISLGTDELKDSVLFGSHLLPAGAVAGNVYNDLNRNGVRDTLEADVSGRDVILTAQGSWQLHGVTDSAGAYLIPDVTAGAVHAVVLLPDHWRQSAPLLPYDFTLSPNDTATGIDFGVYELQTGSISGVVFNDTNANGVRDAGEVPLAGREVQLRGGATASGVTDSAGAYLFAGLWPQNYLVQLAGNSHWRQTFPPLLQPHSVTLADEDNRTGVDFGVTYDSSFNLAFRTFLAESIAYAADNKGKRGKLVKRRPVASEATFAFDVPAGGGIDGLRAIFNQPMDSTLLSAPRFSTVTHNAKLSVWDFGLQPGETLATGEHIVIFAHGNKGSSLRLSYKWKLGTLLTASTTATATSRRLLLPMPNAINMVQELYTFTGLPFGLTVGMVPGPHSVYHPKYTDVTRSLIDKHGIHIGPPRCLGITTSLRSIKNAVKSLPPTKGNNVLFAEALAFKVNLRASEVWITPTGLGTLIFRGDSGNPFNGYSLRRIADSLDHAMSAYDETGAACIYDENYFGQLYATIRMIDSAFSGPLDTLSFATATVLTPVRAMADVPFLEIDSSFSPAAFGPPQRSGEISPLPASFSLGQNYPNPFNPATTISFSLPQAARVTLVVYDLLGREVGTLLDGEELDEGDQEVEFDAGGLASGVYFYRLDVQTATDPDEGMAETHFSNVKKMMLMR